MGSFVMRNKGLQLPAHMDQQPGKGTIDGGIRQWSTGFSDLLQSFGKDECPMGSEGPEGPTHPVAEGR